MPSLVREARGRISDVAPLLLAPDNSFAAIDVATGSCDLPPFSRRWTFEPAGQIRVRSF